MNANAVKESIKQLKLSQAREDTLYPRKMISYSAYAQWTFAEETDNLSRIYDRLLRITTKVTSSYAGDILFLLDDFREKSQMRLPYCKVLSFRENGVNFYDAGFDEKGNLFAFIPNDYRRMGVDGIQFWLFAHNAKENTTLLMRCLFSSGWDAKPIIKTEMLSTDEIV